MLEPAVAGTGLARLAQRVGVVRGELSVARRPDGGTILSASFRGRSREDASHGRPTAGVGATNARSAPKRGP